MARLVIEGFSHPDQAVAFANWLASKDVMLKTPNGFGRVQTTKPSYDAVTYDGDVSVQATVLDWKAGNGGA